MSMFEVSVSILGTEFEGSIHAIETISNEAVHYGCLSLNYVYVYIYVCVRAQSCLILWDALDCSLQAPLPMGFSRQEHWSGLPCPPPGDLSDAGMEPTSPASQVNSLLLNHPGSIFLRSHRFSSNQRLFFQGYLMRPAWVTLDESSNLRVLESVIKFSSKSPASPRDPKKIYGVWCTNASVQG